GWSVEAGELGRYAYEKHANDDDFGQAGTLYRDVMTATDRDHLVTNIVGHAGNHVTDAIQLRVIAYWSSVDTQLGARVAAGLGHKGTNGGGESAAAKKAADLVAGRANRA
ncbi:MAG: catalase-related domain-containing protein, partial [Candidatus Dormiibacterota bacterium]